MIKRDPYGRLSLGKLDFVIQALIVLSLIAFAAETLPNLDASWQRYLAIFEAITVAIFTIEYLARLFLSTPKFSYALSFFGLIDLLAILPFYIASGIDLRSLRAFR